MGELDVIGAVAYYIFMIVGSVSAGYLVVRFTYPDVRTFSNPEKLGASALLGAFIGILSVLADVVSSGMDTVFHASGNWPAFWLGATAAGFGIMYFGLRRPAEREVVVPATKRLQALQKELQDIEAKPPTEHGQLKAKLDQLRKKGLIEAPQVRQLSSSTPGGQSPIAVKENVRETRRVLEKAREVEVETILKDLHLATPAKPAAHESVGRHHRLYMAHGPAEARVEREMEVDVYGSMAEAAKANKERDLAKDTLTDLGKKKETHGDEPKPETGAHGRKPRHLDEPEAKKADAPPQGTGAVTMADLFGNAPAAPKEKSIFAQMEAEDKQVSVVSTKTDTLCPTCHQHNSRIVFCPYCGTGMCANCSPSIVPGPQGFTYTCPKCQEEILVKKKAEKST